MSIATVVTRGFGSFGSVNLLPTYGYSSAEAPEAVIGSIRVAAVESRPGIVIQGVDATPAKIKVRSVEFIP